MTLHHTTRTALDIQDRLEDLHHHLKRPELNREDVLNELRAITKLVRGWSWFQTDRKFADRVAKLLANVESAESDDDIVTAALRFADNVSAVVDPF
jgi:hypothetical protein